MKKALELTEENAKALFKISNPEWKDILNKTFGENVFIENITERVKTFKDACEIEGINVDNFYSKCMKQGDTDDEIAYKEMKLIARVLNEGWKPNWDDNDEYKWWPYFDMSSGSGFACAGYGHWSTGTDVGSRLCYKSKELADYAGKQFNSHYKKFMQ